MADGQSVAFLFESRDSAGKAADSLAADGHEILAITPRDDAVRVEVRKGSAPG